MGRVNDEEAQQCHCPDQLEMDEFVGLFSTESILRDEQMLATNDAAPRRDPTSSRACDDQRTNAQAVGKAIETTATQEKPSSVELPHGWERAADPRSGKVFYLNHLTKTTQWEPPPRSPEGSNDMKFVKHSTSAGSKLGPENSSIYFKNSFRGGRSVQFNARDAYNSSEQVRCIQNLVRSKKKGTVMALSKSKGGFGSNSTACKRRSNEDSKPKHSQPDSKKRRHAAVASASKTLKGGVARRGDRESNETRWDANFKSLAEYTELHGHTNVPQKTGQLGKWVNNVRQEYRKKELGRKSSLTKERIKQLDDIGFQWVASKGVSRKNDKIATSTKKHVKERIVTIDGRRVRETTIVVTTTTIRRETLEEKDPASVTVEGQEETDIREAS